MLRRTPRSTRTDTLCPYTTLFRSMALGALRRIDRWMAVIGDLPAVGLVAARAVGAEQALVRIAERMAARAIERGLGGQASSVCRHARQRLPPLRHVEQRGVFHAEDRSEERRVGKGCVGECESRG